MMMLKNTLKSSKILQKTLNRPNFSNLRKLHTSNFTLAKNLYSVLGVPQTATQKEIKKAYYTLAKKYHPDANPDDKAAETKFAEAAEAYEVLGDDGKRKQYDTLGSAQYKAQQDYRNQPGGGGGAPGGGFGGQSFHGNIDPNELFEKIFSEFAGSGGRKANRQRMGHFFDGFSGSSPDNEYRADHEADAQFFDTGPYKVEMSLKFEEAAKGCNKRVNLEVYDKCVTCDGSGAEKGSKVGRCGYCAGTGVEQIQTGPFVMRGTCRKCGGSGKIILQKCGTCGGGGLSKQKKSMAIGIPAGIENGNTIRVMMGRVEVFVTCNVMASREFKRDGWNVQSTARIGVAQAVLGGAIHVRTLHGEETVVIEPGTSSGELFKLANRGIKKLQEYGHGDHIVTLEIQVPDYDSLTQTQLDAITAFGEDETYAGWANSITQENKKSRQKYDKKSRKFYTEEDVKKEDSDKSESDENTTADKTENAENADKTEKTVEDKAEEELLKKNSENAKSARS